MSDNPSNVSSAIEKCLELEWADKREVRAQSWKTIEMSIAIIAGVFGALYVTKDNTYFDVKTIKIIGGGLLIIASLIGIWICICHSVREFWIMQIISKLEKNIIISKSENIYTPDITNLFLLISEADLTINKRKQNFGDEEKSYNNINYTSILKILKIFFSKSFSLKKVSTFLIVYHIMFIILGFIILFVGVTRDNNKKSTKCCICCQEYKKLSKDKSSSIDITKVFPGIDKSKNTSSIDIDKVSLSIDKISYKDLDETSHSLEKGTHAAVNASSPSKNVSVPTGDASLPLKNVSVPIENTSAPTEKNTH